WCGSTSSSQPGEGDTMKRTTPFAAAVLFAAALATPASAVEVLKTEVSSLDVGGRLQLLGFAEHVVDPSRNDGRAYMFLKQARLSLAGEHQGFKLKMQVAFGGEDEIKAPSPGISLALLDLYADVPVKALGDAHVRVGQFKV